MFHQALLRFQHGEVFREGEEGADGYVLEDEAGALFGIGVRHFRHGGPEGGVEGVDLVGVWGWSGNHGRIFR